MKNIKFSTYQYFLSTAARQMIKKLKRADMVIRNNGRSLVNILLCGILPVVTRLRGHHVQDIYNFLRQCSKLAKRSGVKYLVLYLKASQVLLQQSVGGYIISDTRLLKVAVSRSRSGLPRLIPSRNRLNILNGSRSEIRFWMTLFGLYRVLGFKSVVDISTIIEPGKVIPGDAIIGFQRFIHNYFFKVSLIWGDHPLVLAALTRNKKDKIPLWTEFIGGLTAQMFHIAKSSPTTESLDWRDEDATATLSTSFRALQKAARTWTASSFEPLYLDFQQWCKYTGSDWMISLIQTYSQVPGDISPALGKLSLKEEPAGKIRVFAMVDAFTQWAFYPLHQVIVSVLKTWPMDGTFDQMAPVKRLLANPSITGLWSFDLSAATDRLPLQFQKIVLQPILGLHGAEVWGRLLVNRDYSLTRSPPCRYAVGQPMGAYSSWAMLALTHHALIQWAWYRVCLRAKVPYSWFTLYAVLGDDVVIAEPRVAAEYCDVMAILGVKIGLAKSLISPNKLVGEFAKRYFIPKDASMVPIKEVVAARHNTQELLQFVVKYKLSLSQALTFAGFGYKVKGSLNKKFSQLGRRVSNLLLALSHPSGPFSVGLLNWLQSVGWGRLGKALGVDTIKFILESEISRVQERLQVRLEDKKLAFKMMMVKRDHGQRDNPYDEYYPLYSMVESKVGDYSYKFDLLGKELKALSEMGTDLSVYYKLVDLERRLALLPKPDNWQVRESEVILPQSLPSLIRLYRKCAKRRVK